MKFAGLLVMPAGFFLAVAALVLFPASNTAARAAFVVCGLGVEALGLARCHSRAHGRRGKRPAMTPTPAALMNDATFALVLLLLAMAPLAIAGVALINAGLGRSRSAAQSLLGSVVVAAIAVIAFTLVGATFVGTVSGAGHVLHIAGTPWNWAGAGPFFLSGLGTAGAQAQLGLLFQFLAVALAAIIPWGSGADRLRLTAGCAISAVLAAIVSFLFSRTGSGPAGGSPSSASTFLWAQDFSIPSNT